MKPNAKFELIYSGKCDGWAIADFHRKCDGQGPTVVLMKSSKDFKFGGFASIPWASTGGWKNDNESFIFSLDQRELLFKPNLNGPYHIHLASDWGPNFSSWELGFVN